ARTNASLLAKRAQALSVRPYFDLILSSASSPSQKRQQSTIKPHPISLSRSISMPRRTTLPRCEFESTSMLRPHSYCPDGSDAQIRCGRLFCQSRSATNFNTKICDKRTLLSTAQLKAYARRWVRLKGMTVTRSYLNTDEHWQSMSINGDQ